MTPDDRRTDGPITLKATLGKRVSLAFMANQVPLKTNRIELHPTVRDKWGPPCAYIIKDWHGHDRALMDTLADQCAEILRHFDGVGNYQVSEFGSVYMARERRFPHRKPYSGRRALRGRSQGFGAG